jgi:predicted KAP-like P-loop ATPase
MRINTFEESYTDLKTFADELESFINVEHRYVEGSLVLSLNAPFGSGKSTFLDLWSNRFASSTDENKPTIVRINAWEDDYCGDALVSIVSALIDALQQDGKKPDAILNAAKDVGNCHTGVGDIECATAGFFQHLNHYITHYLVFIRNIMKFGTTKTVTSQ